jgi:hypothetical protein
MVTDRVTTLTAPCDYFLFFYGCCLNRFPKRNLSLSRCSSESLNIAEILYICHLLRLNKPRTSKPVNPSNRSTRLSLMETLFVVFQLTFVESKPFKAGHGGNDVKLLC